MQQHSTTNTLICQSSNIIALTLIARVLLVYHTPGRLITTYTTIVYTDRCVVEYYRYTNMALSLLVYNDTSVVTIISPQ